MSDSATNSDLDQLSVNSRRGLANTVTKNATTNKHRSQGIFWIATIPESDFNGELPDSCNWIRGQLEQGNNTGYRHWQLVFAFKKKGSLRSCQSIFGKTGHYELSRSAAANDYVFKEDTRVEGTRFELGNKPFLRNW